MAGTSRSAEVAGTSPDRTGVAGTSPDRLDLKKVLQIVRPLVVEQGEIAVRRWPEAVPAHHKDRRDFATQVDLEIEANLKAGLSAAFPHHALSGEETGDVGESEYSWLIDPIDGTKYYAGQSSLFSVSVGLLHHGEPVLGVVYSAASRQCFHAVRGSGAFLDDQRLEGSSVGELSEAIVNVDTPNSDQLTDDEREWFETKFLVLNRQAYRVRALGHGSLAACWLASGALDAYVDLTGYATPQDLAAGRIIASEAGMQVAAVDPGVGPPRWLAAPSAVFEKLMEILESCV